MQICYDVFIGNNSVPWSLLKSGCVISCFVIVTTVFRDVRISCGFEEKEIVMNYVG